MNNLLGITYWLYFLAHDGSPEQAIESYLKNIEKNPYDYTKVLDLSILLEILGQFENAEKMRSHALFHQTLYLLENKNSYDQSMRYSRKLYDQQTLVFFNSNDLVTILKSPSDLFANASVEVLLQDNTVQIHYVQKGFSAQSINNSSSIFIGIAPLTENIDLLESLQDLDELLEIPVLNDPKHLLNVIRSKNSLKFTATDHAVWCTDACSLLEKLKKVDDFYYQYHIVLLQGKSYLYDVSIGKILQYTSSEEETNLKPFILEMEKQRFLNFHHFQNKHQHTFNQLWEEFHLDFMIIDCLENENCLHIQDINTNHILNIYQGTDRSRNYRVEQHAALCDAFNDLINYSGTMI